MRFEITTRVLNRALSSGCRIRSVGGTVRPTVARVLVVVGACFLAITIGAYSWMTAEQHHLMRIQSRVKSADLGAPVSDASAPAHARSDQGVTLLSIPKLHLQAAVLEGTDRKTLLLAPGHLKKTALPGDPGNSVIAGHRDTFFRHVYELSVGDEILVQRAGRQYHYVVSSKSIVGPHDTWVASPTQDTRLTLVTCYPTYYIGPAPERAIVIATLHPDTSSSPRPLAAAKPSL